MAQLFLHTFEFCTDNVLTLSSISHFTLSLLFCLVSVGIRQRWASRRFFDSSQVIAKPEKISSQVKSSTSSSQVESWFIQKNHQVIFFTWLAHIWYQGPRDWKGLGEVHQPSLKNVVGMFLAIRDNLRVLLANGWKSERCLLRSKENLRKSI